MFLPVFIAANMPFVAVDIQRWFRVAAESGYYALFDLFAQQQAELKGLRRELKSLKAQESLIEVDRTIRLQNPVMSDKTAVNEWGRVATEKQDMAKGPKEEEGPQEERLAA